MKYYGKLYEYIKSHGKEIKENFPGFEKCQFCGRKKELEKEACDKCLHTLLYDRAMHLEKPSVKTKSGRTVRSGGEKFIDDWLFDHGVEVQYEREIKEFRDLPGGHTLRFCDWYLPQKKLFVEFWGSVHKKYPNRRKIKERMYKQSGLNLLSIEQEDIENLDYILKKKLRNVGILLE